MKSMRKLVEMDLIVTKRVFNDGLAGKYLYVNGDPYYVKKVLGDSLLIMQRGLTGVVEVSWFDKHNPTVEVREKSFWD
ncbi:hypothetical protein [Brevibacillus marinus]|uniref:hypothetical protein n=1 Tax=Brevibacillus marinus TaxID=2496837 RepID=UPI000F82209F|nr:hypothetical protein [Brevibacillus marinus]